MVDTDSRTQTEAQKLVRDLRKRLEATVDPVLQETLLRVIAELERIQEAGAREQAARTLTPAPSSLIPRARILAALEAAGLTRDPGELAVTGNAKVVLEKRYFLRDDKGNVVEDAERMFRRVARAIAEVDRRYPSPGSGQAVTDADVQAVEEEFYRVMARLEFLPNSPTLMNAGTGAGTLSACFVLPLEDSMQDIMKTATDIAMVQKFGGGTGVALSRLRPKGAHISTTHGRACGPIAVLKHLSSVSTMITQGGKRDGANMAVMDVHHQDILEFITCKHQEGVIHNYNISAGVDEEFMQAVEQGGKLELRDPRDDPFDGARGGRVVGELDARDVFQKMVEGAWRNGEPGMIFLDRVNRDNPTPHLGRITATNPCGEQPLLPYESCNLGSINLARMLAFTAEGAQIDWEKLRRTVRLAVHFLDNVIDANRYSVPEIERMTRLTRKIGLGVMGFADMLVRLGIPYDSEEGLEMGRRIMRFIREEADNASEALAGERGVFPAFSGSLHDAPAGRRLRNACRLTVAPTGTISMIAGCSSGVEPLFALAFRKQNILEGQTLYYINDAFEAVARHEGFYSDALTDSLSQGRSLKQAPVARGQEIGENKGEGPGGREEGSLTPESLPLIPEGVRRVFVTAPDIAPEWHVRMQAAFQDSTDAAISKTINFPNEATVEDVRAAYLLAWKLGCKGITVYRAGSREQEVLTAGTREKAGARGQESADGGQEAQTPDSRTLPLFLTPRPRPQQVRGVTERIRTGHGNMYITINFGEEGRPFEVFTNLGKAGGCDSAQLEAVARLVSMALRAGVDPDQVVGQLRGITCCPAWDNGVLVKSAPDALALALARAIGKESPRPAAAQPALIDRSAVEGGVKEPITGLPESKVPAPGRREAALRPPGDGDGQSHWGHCPECSGLLVFQEGCLMCRECGYNKCG